jgi:hypothetical protein
MKRLLVSLIFGILLVSSIGMVIAESEIVLCEDVDSQLYGFELSQYIDLNMHFIYVEEGIGLERESYAADLCIGDVLNEGDCDFFIQNKLNSAKEVVCSNGCISSVCLINEDYESGCVDNVCHIYLNSDLKLNNLDIAISNIQIGERGLSSNPETGKDSVTITVLDEEQKLYEPQSDIPEEIESFENEYLKIDLLSVMVSGNEAIVPSFVVIAYEINEEYAPEDEEDEDESEDEIEEDDDEEEVEEEDEEENETECEDLTQEDCESNTECTYYPNDRGKGNVEGWCKETKDNDEDKDKKGPQGYAFGYKFRLQERNMSFHEFKTMIREKFGNKSEIDGEVKVYLSNGRKANLKIMPNVASEKALKRLRLRNCNESNNCSIELKEIGSKNKTRAAYEVQIQRHEKLLGLFRMRAQNRVQVDAETGEIIGVKKPWWSFLAVDEEEVEEEIE